MRLARRSTFLKIRRVLFVCLEQVVKENCWTEYKGESPQDDLMEMLLKKWAH